MKKRFMLLMLIVIFFIMLFCTSASAYEEYSDPGINLNITTSTLNIYLPDGQKQVMEVAFCNGRVCVPFKEFLSALGGTYRVDGKNFLICVGEKYISVQISPAYSNRCIMVYDGGKAYVYLYEIIEPLGYIPLFEEKTNTIRIVKKSFDYSNAQVAGNTAWGKNAYIRLEDIMADGMDTDARYTMENIEKLRFMAEYLYNNNQQYYIAWIPVYRNPKTNIYNDITENKSLYNTAFIYTLDYMADHGGHLGLHGYTHQYGEERSADGYEWGANTPLSLYEQQHRMILAKQACAKLGYKEEFFEFPHYGATSDQLKMAEYYFDAIYQSYPSNALKNTVVYTTVGDKKLYYIPTPADYVKHVGVESCEETISKLLSDAGKGNAVSLFFHPTLDMDLVQVTGDGDGGKVFSYIQGADLPKILNAITGIGYNFSTFK